MNTTTLNMTTLDGGVIIKKGGGGTPTPPSGGSGGGDWRYFDVRGLEQKLGIGELGAMLARLEKDAEGSGTIIVPSAYLAILPVDKVTAYAVEMSGKTNMTGELLTFKQMYTDSLIETLAGMGVVEITEEEFYNLE